MLLVSVNGRRCEKFSDSHNFFPKQSDYFESDAVAVRSYKFEQGCTVHESYFGIFDCYCSQTVFALR